MLLDGADSSPLCNTLSLCPGRAHLTRPCRWGWRVWLSRAFVIRDESLERSPGVVGCCSPQPSLRDPPPPLGSPRQFTVLED